MPRFPHLALCLGLLVAGSCHQGPRSRSSLSFDDIAARIATLNAAEIVTALGEPDSRQPVYLRDERWIWWNYTFLAGNDYAPEVRGQVVHLEVTLRNPAGTGHERPPYTRWHIAQPNGIAYRRPGTSRPVVPAAVSLQESNSRSW